MSRCQRIVSAPASKPCAPSRRRRSTISRTVDSAIAFGESYEIPRPRKRIEARPDELEAFTGKYQGADTFAIARDGARLMMQIPPGVPAFELYPESRLEFFASRPEYYLTFCLDEAGRVTSVRIRNEGQEGQWTRVP